MRVWIVSYDNGKRDFDTFLQVFTEAARRHGLKSLPAGIVRKDAVLVAKPLSATHALSIAGERRDAARKSYRITGIRTTL